MSREVAALLAAVTVVGCTSRAAPPPARWTPAAPVGWSASAAPWGVAPMTETRDPWWSAGAPRPDASMFLVVLDLRGPGGAARLPDAKATVARLGGVQRTSSVWEVAPQPGGGLGALAAMLERELCAEDLVVVYRARQGGIERSEFAGHRACRPEASPAAPLAAPPAALPPPARPDPFYDRF